MLAASAQVHLARGLLRLHRFRPLAYKIPTYARRALSEDATCISELIGFIASARKEADITQVELTARLGRPESFVPKVERAERRIDGIEFLPSR